jgi:hypothetical protein
VKLPGAPFEFSDPLVEPDPLARLRSALDRSPWRRKSDLTAVIAVVNGRGEVRIEDRAGYAVRLRRSDASTAFLVQAEPVPRGSVLVLSRESDGRRLDVVDLLGPKAR